MSCWPAAMRCGASTTSISAGKRTSAICMATKGSTFTRPTFSDRGELDQVFAESRPETVFHLAANSDISLGNKDRSLDLRLTFLTTIEVLEAMQRHGMKQYSLRQYLRSFRR